MKTKENIKKKKTLKGSNSHYNYKDVCMDVHPHKERERQKMPVHKWRKEDDGTLNNCGNFHYQLQVHAHHKTPQRNHMHIHIQWDIEMKKNIVCKQQSEHTHTLSSIHAHIAVSGRTVKS